MIAADLASINTVTVDMVGGDRILRQGSDSIRTFVIKINGVAVSLPPTPTFACQVRDADNNTLAMTTPAVVGAAGAGTGEFTLTFTALGTEAVTPEAGFTFVEERIDGRAWLVFNGVFDVEITSGTYTGCPVQGKIKMRRGVTRA